MFGVLTEGVRHFTAYIPSPRSRIRAFEDVGACVAEILSDVRVSRAAGGVAASSLDPRASPDPHKFADGMGLMCGD